MSLRFLSLTFLLVVIGTALASACAKAQSTVGDRVALLIGVNQYERRGFRNLQYAERDVEDVAKVLSSDGYQLQLLTGSGVAEKRATLANIRLAVEKALSDRKKSDLVVIALAGHGFQIKIGDTGQTARESFFCPVDAQKDDPDTMLSIGWLLDEIDRRGGGRNLVLVDACREDPARSRGMNGSVVKTLPEGVAVLFGCRAGQQTFETRNAGGGHGVFFHYVLEGLRGKAKNEEGEVTWSRLTDYVSRQVHRETPKLVGRANIQQTPNLIANIPGSSPVIVSADWRPAGVLKAGDTWKDNSLAMEFGWCPPGKFAMGSPNDDPQATAGEVPSVNVTLTKGFWIGRTEVTRRQWERVMSTTPWKTIRGRFPDGANYPVSLISWYDSIEFCNKFSEKEKLKPYYRMADIYREDEAILSATVEIIGGDGYCLPTEAQWEYACRAGSQSKYSFGADLYDLADYAWYADNTKLVGQDFPREVGTKKANAWGLFDFHGNVWERCWDSYQDRLPGGKDPVVSANHTNRASRGGGWDMPASFCRSAYRSGYHPRVASHSGFRVVRNGGDLTVAVSQRSDTP